MKHFRGCSDVETLDLPSFDLPRAPKHVAVLCFGSNIHAVFTNRYAFHAEELAIHCYVHLPEHVKKKRVRLYITRISRNPMSRPCKHCCSLLKRFPEIRVFYTDENGEWVEEKEFSNPHISSRRKALGYCSI